MENPKIDKNLLYSKSISKKINLKWHQAKHLLLKKKKKETKKKEDIQDKNHTLSKIKKYLKKYIKIQETSKMQWILCILSSIMSMKELL